MCVSSHVPVTTVRCVYPLTVIVWFYNEKLCTQVCSVEWYMDERVASKSTQVRHPALLIGGLIHVPHQLAYQKSFSMSVDVSVDPCCAITTSSRWNFPLVSAVTTRGTLAVEDPKRCDGKNHPQLCSKKRTRKARRRCVGLCMARPWFVAAIHVRPHLARYGKFLH